MISPRFLLNAAGICLVVVNVMLLLVHGAAAQLWCGQLCGDVCTRVPDRIALITDLTGPSARRGLMHREGAQLAVEHINREGGRVYLNIYDTQGRMAQNFVQVERAIYDRAKVVIGGFHREIAERLAIRYPEVLFFSLSTRYGWTSMADLFNVFILPWELAERTERLLRDANKTDCPQHAPGLQTYAVFQVLGGSVNFTGSENIPTLIKSLRGDRFKTALGTISSRRSPGIFDFD